MDRIAELTETFEMARDAWRAARADRGHSARDDLEPGEIRDPGADLAAMRADARLAARNRALRRGLDAARDDCARLAAGNRGLRRGLDAARDRVGELMRDLSDVADDNDTLRGLNRSLKRALCDAVAAKARLRDDLAKRQRVDAP